MPWEIVFLEEIQRVFASPLGRVLTTFCARYVIGLFLPIIAWIRFGRASKQEKHLMAEAIWAGIIALALATVFAYVIGRPRPFLASPLIELRIPPPTHDVALPSGHTSTAFALAGIIAYAIPEYALGVYVLAGLVALGRMMAGVHYPTDILAGIVLGSVSALFVRWSHGVLARSKKPLA